MKVKSGVLLISAQSFFDEDKVYDGLRLRTLGLASGLLRNGVEVHIAFHNDQNTSFTSNGFHFITWKDLEDFKNVLGEYKVILFNYASLGLNEMLANIIEDSQFLIADALVPIELENKHRSFDSGDHIDSGSLQILRRANLILVSNEKLIEYYTDLLIRYETKFAAPHKDYKDSKDKKSFMILPFGLDSTFQIHNKHYVSKYERSNLNLVWYGGIYPWFGIQNLLNFLHEFSTLSQGIHLTIIGGINPFYSNDNLLNDQWEKVKTLVIGNSNIKQIPWLPYDIRIPFLSQFDAAIFFNDEKGQETSLSWRTRYSDFILAKLPLIVNCLDPFATLISNHGGVRVFSDAQLANLVKSKIDRKNIKSELLEIKSLESWSILARKLDWDNLTSTLSKAISQI